MRVLGLELRGRLLREGHPKSLVDRLTEVLDRRGYISISPAELAAPTRESRQAANALLERVAADGLVTRETHYACPACSEGLLEEHLDAELCPKCDQAFADHDGILRANTYVRLGGAFRDVPWVLVLHGMNTRGPWQEELTWMVARAYGRSVPVAVYKYGVVRPGAFLEFRQRQLTRRLLGEIHRLCGDSEKAGLGARPDVIAHSLGTWLLGHALQSDQDLRLGRVVLLGSILRPDFGWASLLQQNRVEAVLNHHGTRDIWAGATHWFIPDSGPSGRRGFDSNDLRVHNVPAKDFGHSTFFAPQHLPAAFHDVWHGFLRGDTPPPVLTIPKRAPWKQSCWFLRATMPRMALLGSAAAIFVFACTSLAVGAAEVLHVLWTLVGSPWALSP
jgi:ribosomal protein S27AE